MSVTVQTSPSRAAQTVQAAQALWQSVLSQDVVSSAAVLVDSTSPSPVALFTPPSASQAEALIIQNVENAGRRLCHVLRDPGGPSGWRVVPLFGSQPALEVVAGTPYSGSTSATTVHCVFSGETALYVTTYQAAGGGWSPPVQILNQAVSQLQVAYSPLGNMVVYGKTAAGDLVTAWKPAPGAPLAAGVCSMQGGLLSGDFQLCLTGESAWTLAVNASGVPTLYTGTLGATEYASTQAPGNFQGPVRKVVFGYWSDTYQTLLFLFTDGEGKLQSWASNASSGVIAAQPVRNGKMLEAMGYVDGNGLLHVYGIDDKETLWALHQPTDTQWDDNGLPLWAPAIPLDTGIAAVVADPLQTGAATLLALDGADFSLRLHAQDAVSRLWNSGPILQPAATATEVSRFRVEVQMLDANGNPVPGCAVTLGVASGGSAVEIEVGGAVVQLDSTGTVPLSADDYGKVTIAVLATSNLSTPSLVLDAAGLPAPVAVVPSQGIHTYLSGQGTLNPTNPQGALPVFDASGDTLKAATVGGKTLAPGLGKQPGLASTAAQAIQNTAKVGLGQTAGIAGYAGSLRPGATRFTVFRGAEELEAWTARAGVAAPMSVWGDITHFFGDLWEGIKNGAIKIWDFTVDAVNKVASFAVEVGDYFEQGVKLALQGVEEAAHFIAGVFQAIAAAVEEVIDWLKALFDFPAIWRTKQAFQQALTQTPSYASELLGMGRQIADNWFTQQKAIVNNAFDQEIAKLRGKKIGDLQNWHQPGPGYGSTPIIKGVKVDGIQRNVHHNWFQSKVSAHVKSSALPPTPAVNSATGAGDSWSAFAQQVSQVDQDLMQALKDAKNALEDVINHPASFTSMAIPDLLAMVKSVIDAALSLCDAVVDGFVALAQDVLSALGALFEMELHLGVFHVIWDWIADLAGAKGEDRKLTVGALVSLIAAFPCTLIYKLIEGVDNEPFPAGQLPNTRSRGVAAKLGKMSGTNRGCHIAAAVLQMLYSVPAVISQSMGPNTPRLLSVGMVGTSMVMWGLENGYPELSTLEWAGAAALAANVAWIAPAIYFVLKAKFAELLEKYSLARYDLLLYLAAIAGAGQELFGLYTDVATNPGPGTFEANIMLPWVSMIPAVLNTTEARSNEFAPLLISADMLLVAGCYIAGGCGKLVDAIAE